MSFRLIACSRRAKEAAGYFDLRLKNLIKLYPSQKELLERGCDDKSRQFTLWSDEISRWFKEKWGLEAGDFFPLYKDLS